MPELATQGQTAHLGWLRITQHKPLETNRTLVGADADQLVAAPFEIGNELAELAWKILMNEQQPQPVAPCNWGIVADDPGTS